MVLTTLFSLTIPSFRLVIFSDIGFYVDNKYKAARINIEKLINLNDPRIWVIGTDSEFNNQTDWQKINVDDIGKELHFFDTIANNLFPDFTQDRIEEANKNLIKQLRVKIEEGND